VRILYHHRTQAEDAQGVHIYSMVQAFRKLGHRVHIVSLVQREVGEEAKGRRFWKLVARMSPPGLYEILELLYNVVGYFRIRAEIRRFRPDFVYERYTLNTFAGVLAARRQAIPVVLEVNSPFAFERSLYARLVFRRTARAIERWVCSHADKVIAVSEVLKKNLVEIGVPEEKVLVLHNAVEESLFSSGAEGDTVRRRFGLEEEVVVGFVGWFRKWHGLESLISALARLKNEGMRLKLLLVGEGPAWGDIVRQARLAGFLEDIVLAGPATHEMIPSYLAAMDIAVQPSATSYCCPLKVIEYMAAGKAIVAPRQENLTELLEEGRTALLFEPGDDREMADALMRLVADRRLRETLGASAKEEIARRGMTWTENATRILELVREIRTSLEGTSVLMLLSNAFAPDPRVAQEARALVGAGCRVRILAWDRERSFPERETWNGVEIERVYVSSSHGRGTSQMLFLAGFWAKCFFKKSAWGARVVHCHDFDTLPLGFALAKLAGARVVFDAHESFADMLGPNVSSLVKSVIRKWEHLLLPRLDALITVGEILKSEYEAHGAVNCWVVGNWKKLEEYQIRQEEIERVVGELGAKGRRVVSFISWLGKERKLEPLIEAVKGDTDTFLVIAGDGPLRGMVESVARENSNIAYLGYLDPERVPLYTKLADLVYYGFDPENPNSKYSAPNKLFEALAAGCAIVTGNFGEIGKIVREGKCGLVLEELTPAALRKAMGILKDDRLLAEMKSRALELGRRQYNWDKAEERLLRCYRGIVGNPEREVGTCGRS